MNDHKEGKGAHSKRTAPAKLFQKGHKKDGERVPDPISQSERDKTDTNDYPTEVERTRFLHNPPLVK